MLENTPTIPRRPLKKDGKDQAPETPSRSKSETPPEAETESAPDTIAQTDSLPLIPPRPRSKNSGSFDQLSSDKSSNNPSLNSEFENESDLAADGDKTPGNSKTKISFKDNVDDVDNNIANSETSSFNDDQETFLQDKEGDSNGIQDDEADEEPEQVANENAHPNDIASLTDNMSTKPEIPTRPEIPSRPSANKKSEESTVESNESAKETLEPERDDDSIKDKEIQKETENDEPVINNPIENKLKSEESAKPVEPREEKDRDPQEEFITEKKEEQKVEETPTPSTTSENIAEEKELESLTSSNSKVDLGHSSTTKDSVKEKPPPVVPSRPAKTGSASETESFDPPKESPDKQEKSSLESEKQTPKAPPPKPKKLSSKIAAFQQMLNQPQDDAKESDSLDSKEKPSVPQRPQARSKLSNRHMNFAQNLQGMLGRGTALPGMVDPSRLQNDAESSDKDTETEEKLPEKEQESTSEPPREPVRRARGPRGKRLPKALKDPVKVEQNSRFDIVSHKLWDVTFTKTAVPKKETSTTTDDLALEAETKSSKEDEKDEVEADEKDEVEADEKSEDDLITDYKNEDFAELGVQNKEQEIQEEKEEKEEIKDNDEEDKEDTKEKEVEFLQDTPKDADAKEGDEDEILIDHNEANIGSENTDEESLYETDDFETSAK